MNIYALIRYVSSGKRQLEIILWISIVQKLESYWNWMAVDIIMQSK